MSTQAPVQKHFYDLPTCLLEVWSERSPLSEWSDRPIAQNLRFRLTIEENGRFGRIKQKTIQGNQNLLGKIIESVADYADKFLAEDNFSSLSHHLSIPNVPKLNRLNLTTLQLFDLVSSLEQCAIEMTILPTVELEVKRITPAWLKIAALVIATVGVSTSAVKLIFDRPVLEIVTSSNRETGVVEQSPQSKNKDKKEIISNATTTPTIKIAKQSPQPATQREHSETVAKSPSSSPTPEFDRGTLEPKRTNAPEPPLGETQLSRSIPIAPPNPSPRTVTKPNTSSSSRSDSLSDIKTPENNTQKYGQDNLSKPAPILPSRPSEMPPPAPAIAPPVAPVDPSINSPNRATTSGEVTSQSRAVQSRDLSQSRSPVNLPAPQAGIVANTSNIQIESIETTLSEDIKISLSKYIKTTSLSDTASGEIVFDIALDRGKILQVKLDETASTLKNYLAVENLKRSLLNWQAPASASGKIRLNLSVRANSR